MNYLKTYESFNDISNDVYVERIDSDYDDELIDMIGDDFNPNGSGFLGLFKKDSIIGAVMIEKDYLPWEYRFDVVISKKYRGKGYLKLLINRLIECFNKDDEADQLSATVINKGLTDVLVNKFGFNKGEFNGSDFVWIRKKV